MPPPPPHRANKFIFWHPSKKESCTAREKQWFALVAQYTIQYTIFASDQIRFFLFFFENLFPIDKKVQKKQTFRPQVETIFLDNFLEKVTKNHICVNYCSPMHFNGKKVEWRKKWDKILKNKNNKRMFWHVFEIQRCENPNFFD